MMKDDLAKVVGIFLALVAILGIVVQLWTSPKDVRDYGFLFLFVVLFLLGLWITLKNFWAKYKAEKSLPSLERLENISVNYEIQAATATDISWIAQLESNVYSSSDAVPEHVLKEWYDSNPTGFFIIKMSNGERIGHIDLLPLKPATLSSFLEGKIVEKNIRGDSLYSPDEKGLIKDLYVESIIVRPPKEYSKAAAVLSVLKNFTKIVGNICDPQNVTNVYAIAASSKGEGLLNKLGFEMIKSADKRQDHHKLFRIDFRVLAQNISTNYGVKIPRGLSAKKRAN